MASPASPIRAIVILVQENRSFDHLLGWMKILNPSIDGVTGMESNPVSTSDPLSGAVPFRDQAEYVDPDPGHSIQAIYEQVYGRTFSAGETPITPAGVIPPMNGFVQQAEREKKGMSEAVMNGFRPELVPVYRELVAEFAVCDQWFASVPASTQPNRLFVHSATSHGLTSNDTAKLIAGLPQKTIFDSLDEAGLDFGIYYQYPPSTLFFRNLRRLKYIDRFHQFDLSFERHCKEGKLPNYVVVEQRYFDLKILPGNDDHPSHDVSEGQKLVKQVYEALRSSPQWKEILFVIIYDEHGGFFDHVPTPAFGIPSPDGIAGPAPYYFQFDRLGVRVPAIFISPWIEKGTVVHRPSGPEPSSEFEHSSIPATVKKIFNLSDFLTKRDAWAGTFENILTRKTPRDDCPATLPEVTKKMRRTEADEVGELSDFQRELVQLAGVLNGDHAKVASFPDALLRGMTVAQGATYTQEAFKVFLQEAERCRSCGAEGSLVVALPPAEEEDGAEKKKKKSSWYSKCLVCFACRPQR